MAISILNSFRALFLGKSSFMSEAGRQGRSQAHSITPLVKKKTGSIYVSNTNPFPLKDRRIPHLEIQESYYLCLSPSKNNKFRVIRCKVEEIVPGIESRLVKVSLDKSKNHVVYVYDYELGNDPVQAVNNLAWSQAVA